MIKTILMKKVAAQQKLIQAQDLRKKVRNKKLKKRKKLNRSLKKSKTNSFFKRIWLIQNR